MGLAFRVLGLGTVHGGNLAPVRIKIHAIPKVWGILGGGRFPLSSVELVSAATFSTVPNLLFEALDSIYDPKVSPHICPYITIYNLT